MAVGQWGEGVRHALRSGCGFFDFFSYSIPYETNDFFYLLLLSAIPSTSPSSNPWHLNDLASS